MRPKPTVKNKTYGAQVEGVEELLTSERFTAIKRQHQSGCQKENCN